MSRFPFDVDCRNRTSRADVFTRATSDAFVRIDGRNHARLAIGTCRFCMCYCAIRAHAFASSALRRWRRIIDAQRSIDDGSPNPVIGFFAQIQLAQCAGRAYARTRIARWPTGSVIEAHARLKYMDICRHRKIYDVVLANACSKSTSRTPLYQIPYTI